MSRLISFLFVEFLAVSFLMVATPTAAAQNVARQFAGRSSNVTGRVHNLSCTPGNGHVLLQGANGESVGLPSRLLGDRSFRIHRSHAARVYRLSVYCGTEEVASQAYTREELGQDVEVWARERSSAVPATGIVDVNLWTGRGPREARRGMARSRRAFERGDLEQAVELAEAALSAAPGWFDAVHGLGVLYVRAERYEEAEELLGRVVGHLPNEPGAWSNWGLALWGARRLDEALEAFDRSLVLQPGNQVIARERTRLVSHRRSLDASAVPR